MRVPALAWRVSPHPQLFTRCMPSPHMQPLWPHPQPSPHPNCRQGHFNVVRDLAFPELNDTHIGHPSHKATARELAAKGTVLLKNEGVSAGLRRRAEQCTEGRVEQGRAGQARTGHATAGQGSQYATRTLLPSLQLPAWVSSCHQRLRPPALLPALHLLACSSPCLQRLLPSLFPLLPSLPPLPLLPACRGCCP